MNLDESIERLEELIAEVRQTSLEDDKTALGSALALRKEARLMNEGDSLFEVVVFGDLNDFKQLNDDYSHEAGDVAIYSVGQVLAKLVAQIPNAKGFRQSGDEFVILLPNESVPEFLSLVSALGSIRFSYQEQKGLRTAMSLGYAISDGKRSFSELLERAEAACQNAKAVGDGECVKWTEDLKLNPLVRKSAKCIKCLARVSWTGPRTVAPVRLRNCPACGEGF
ncbi:MAG TPA: GGDEF domain-containing protein [Pyrinomonadaceae bacterium]|jgi:diguanylate cyclase (GGDEF)-like protein|nr:GGDEF domain-containing protein [Pyrinomonadaceae bacterium]